VTVAVKSRQSTADETGKGQFLRGNRITVVIVRFYNTFVISRFIFPLHIEFADFKQTREFHSLFAGLLCLLHAAKMQVWQHFLNTELSIFQKQNSRLILVGVKSSVNAAYRQITEHIKDNIIETRKIQLNGVFASFLQTFPDQIQANVQLACLEWDVSLGKRSEVTLKGKCLDVAKGIVYLQLF